jgi:predicted PurR-regulated permease PerM
MADQHGYTREPDPEDGWLSRQRALVLVLVAATAIAVYLCYRLTLPFLPALAWALALAVIAHPLHSWLVRRLGHANLAAGLAVALVAVALVAPALFLTQQLIREAARGVEWFQSEAAMGRWQAMLEGNPRLAPVLSWIAANVDLRGAVKELPAALTSGASSVVTGSAYLVVELLITLFALFYLFRDRRPALWTIRSLVPLSERETDEVFGRINDTIHATIYGTLVVAAVQGILGGLIFWVLGLPASLLWGTLMALLGIVPVLGAFVVWIPAAVFLGFEGSWGKALILTAWGLGVVSLIDNLLYPILVGQRLRLHTLPVFIAIVGGLTLFGSSGVILGPVILAITVALIEVWRRRTAGGRAAEAGVDAGSAP